MKNKIVIITGCNGGIGSAMVNEFNKNGIITLGIDKQKVDNPNVDYFYQLDLNLAVNNEEYANKHFTSIQNLVNSFHLVGLINNAAVQLLGGIKECKISDFRETLDVNVVAPVLLTKAFLSCLEKNNGCVLNIGSIHARLTKPGFIAYATSKGALRTFTSALAVDFGNKIRVNCIEPAAIETEMLKCGFADKPEGLKELKNHHPTLSIGSPEEVAKVAYMLVTSDIKFLNGATLGVDGGISGRLHDPS